MSRKLFILIEKRFHFAPIFLFHPSINLYRQTNKHTNSIETIQNQFKTEKLNQMFWSFSFDLKFKCQNWCPSRPYNVKWVIKRWHVTHMSNSRKWMTFTLQNIRLHKSGQNPLDIYYTCSVVRNVKLTTQVLSIHWHQTVVLCCAVTVS